MLLMGVDCKTNRCTSDGKNSLREEVGPARHEARLPGEPQESHQHEDDQGHHLLRTGWSRRRRHSTIDSNMAVGLGADRRNRKRPQSINN